MLVNKSWLSVMEYNYFIFYDKIKINRDINNILFNNEILNYQINKIKKNKKCNHNFINYNSITKYCINCKYITNI